MYILSIIWKSNLTDKMKRSFFQAAVVLILLYGCTTWTLTKPLEKKLDGNYTRMLRAILNKSWQQHPTKCICFRSYGNQTWPIKWNAVSSRLRSCWYCYMDALLGRWLNRWRRSLMAITQECWEQYWTSPGSNTPQGTNYTGTYHLSRKLYKLDEPDMPDPAGEARTRS